MNMAKIWEIIVTPEGTCAFRYFDRIPITYVTKILVSRKLENTKYSVSDRFYHGERSKHKPHSPFSDDYCGTTVPGSEKEMFYKLLNSLYFD